MKKVCLLVFLMVLTSAQAQAQTFSSSLPVPPASVVPTTPRPTVTPSPRAVVPVATPAPVVIQPVSGSMDMTYVLALGGLMICALTVYKLKLKGNTI